MPYRDPEVLGLFLKEISYFDYTHSEELGNAYEYLLSIMSSQGDAGQFRTPRHIIDFMVEVVNPTKDDKVLDPACGTGGFLVKSYEHILLQHENKNNSDKKEKPLTPDDRKNLMNNFEGYDIDPTMVRIAQVNMYLHQFKNPKIYQYDTLSSEERWGDKFDVILANPPFKGSIDKSDISDQFKIKSTKTELLFVELFIRLLSTGGRCAAIVPDGVLFGSSKAHQAIRKMIVDDNQLEGIISMPSGVFKPYAGVSAAIMIFTKGGKTDKVWFYDMEADGFSLDDKRQKVPENDIPDIIAAWKARDSKKNPPKSAKWFWGNVTEIRENRYDLSISRYKEIEYEAVAYDAPAVILSNIEKIEKEIQADLDDLRGKYVQS